MPTIGSWGTRLFWADPDSICTFDNFNYKISYKTEQVENGDEKPGTARIAPDLSAVNLQIHASISLGVDVPAEIDAWKTACEQGLINALIVGSRAVGDHQYMIKSMQVANAIFDSHGEIIDCTIDLAFEEYVQEMERKSTSGSSDSGGGGSSGRSSGGTKPPKSTANDNDYKSGNEYFNSLDRMASRNVSAAAVGAGAAVGTNKGKGK